MFRRSFTLSTTLSTLALAATAFAASTAEARPLRLLGIGASADMSYAGLFEGKQFEDMRVAPEFGLRIDFLWVFGIEASVRPFDLASRGDEPTTARLRASAILYMINTDDFSVNLKAGLGGLSINDLVKPTSVGSTLHAGLGADIELGKGFSIAIEGLVVSTALAGIEARVSTVAEKVGDAIADPKKNGEAKGEVDTFMQSLVPTTFEAKVGLRYFF